jgi:fibronectin-binding autotransporter adhesin
VGGKTTGGEGGSWTDAGGSASGSGINRFNVGALNLRTNTIPGLLLTGGGVFVTGTTTFQQAGAITNLTLDGSTLHGTNKVGSGTLTMNAGGADGQITVQPGGQLALATAGTKTLYNLTLLNQGTVTWSGGSIYGSGSGPATVISNGGLWQITGDAGFYEGIGGGPMFWTNSGTLRKSAGTAITQINSFTFVNQSSGLVDVDSGTLQLPSGTTNSTGTLRLNGGTLQATSGPLTMNGGTLDGAGSLGANSFAGGSISPGQGGAGLIGFTSDLNLGSGATLTIDGTGILPGTQYDQLSVTGAVVLGNCTLQVTSLPAVAPGTTFILIQNDGVDAVSGTFNGLPDNALVNVSGQPFRIHYAGGSGNDVTLVRDGGIVGPQLSSGGYSTGAFQLLGVGGNSVVYTIQATTNFQQWTNVGSGTGDVSGHFNFVDTNAALFRYRFYRTTN